MQEVTNKELLDAGCHFGHLRKKWNPKMLPYIFMERKGIHIIDLNKTQEKMREAASALENIARSGKKILFVGTKKQAKEIISEVAKTVNMPYVTERWLGGMLTNFSTIRRSIKKMQSIEKMLNDPNQASALTKKERLVLSREQEKLDRVLGGIAQLNRLPAALFIVDTTHEHIAVAEARKLNINTFALVDTNSDPDQVDFPIPANDDATKSITIVSKFIGEAIRKGLEDRKNDKAKMEQEMAAQKAKEEEVKAEEAPKEEKKEAAPKAAPKAEKKEAAPKEEKKAEPAKAETKAEADDLKRIEGIGPKIASVLNEAGINSYKDLAGKKADALTEILVSANERYKMYDPTTWPEQAGLAADGKWDELKSLQDSLTGGKVSATAEKKD